MKLNINQNIKVYKIFYIYQKVSIHSYSMQAKVKNIDKTNVNTMVKILDQPMSLKMSKVEKNILLI